MTLDAIKDIPVSTPVADNAQLCLWAAQGQLHRRIGVPPIDQRRASI